MLPEVPLFWGVYGGTYSLHYSLTALTRRFPWYYYTSSHYSLASDKHLRDSVSVTSTRSSKIDVWIQLLAARTLQRFDLVPRDTFTIETTTLKTDRRFTAF